MEGYLGPTWNLQEQDETKYKMCIFNSNLWGSNVDQNQKTIEKIPTSQNSILRSILRIRLKDRVSIAHIKGKTNFKDDAAVAKKAEIHLCKSHNKGSRG